jgi:dipeptidyl aminopeptidase/acylaminoacyl peptidase
LLSRQTALTLDQGWYPSVYDVDVSTGKAKRVVDEMDGVWDWDADAAGNVRFGVIWNDGKKRGVVYRSPGGRFERVMLGKREEDAIPTPKIYKLDGTAIAFADGDGRDGVYELALPSFTLGKKLFGDARYDVDAILLNQSGDGLAGIAITEKRSRVEWLDPTFKEIQGDLDKTVGPGNAEIISWSRDRTKLLVRVANPSQAGALYYWDTHGAAMQRIGWYSTALKSRSLSPVKTVEYKARDGVAIEAVLTLPRGRVAQNLPLIVMPHGGPGARDSEEYDWWAQFMAELGYAVIQPNYRGSTGYGNAFEKMSEGQWGLKMQDDLLDSIAWAANAGIADPKRVCIVGASYGGYAAMRGAQRDGANYRCAVSYAGISDIGVMLRYDRNFLGKWVAEYWKKQVTDSKAVSPRFHAADFGAPILIAHGAKDKRVPIKQSRLLSDELKKAGKPYEYLEQKQGDHHFSRVEDRLEFLKALKAFLDKYNPA